MHQPDIHDTELPTSSPTTNKPRSNLLHVCPKCGSKLVYPLDWNEVGRDWKILLRCPDCENLTTGVFETRIVEELDNEMDRGAAELLGDLRRITHANMAEEAEFFIRALNADVIVPSDF